MIFGKTDFLSPFSAQLATDALLAFSMVALIIFVPKQRDPVRQRMGVYVWSAVFLGTFSLLFAIFRLKNPSYPFRLFL